MCVDYRELNKRTIKDSYALPRIEEVLDSLGGAKYFSVLDMKSGYYQVEVDEDHKERTAFSVGPLGFWEFRRLPFGLNNSPATYQRLMEDVLGDYHLIIWLIYLDDVIIFARTYEEHLERLQMVLQRIREAGLKLSAKKCKFFKERVVYVGHLVSKDGIEADPAKIEVIKTWPLPTSPEVRRFLGFAGYYRKFVKDFACIAQPLNELMPTPVKKTRKKHVQKPWVWGAEQQHAFDQLKAILSSPPILGYANYKQPFELHTDASADGLGAVLYQLQEGQKKVISYASRGLNRAEKNYPAHKLEFLALKWAITEKFKDYLYGPNSFLVYTDNNPLTYVLTTAKLDATGHRWLAALSAYSFSIKYRSGASNKDADALSRLPKDFVTTDSVKAICNSIDASALIDCVCLSETVVDELDYGTDLSEFTDIDWRRAQASDKSIAPWITAIRNRQRPGRRQLPSSSETTAMSKNNNFQFHRGVLYRHVVLDGTERKQLVLPAEYIKLVLNSLHNDVGHPGRDRTLALLRERFYWPNMTRHVEEWVDQCPRCLRRKVPATRAPMVSITSSQPLELICMDYLTLETSTGGFQHILVLTDHFTRYAWAIPTKNQSAHTTADALMNNFILHYGFPKRLHSDQGANFEGKVIQQLWSISGIKKSRTTPCHPMGNGMTEQFNITLLEMLGTLEPDQKAIWKRHVGPLVHAYNCTKHESTSFAPYYLMFGREPRLPADITFGLGDETPSTSVTAYVKDLRERLLTSFDTAKKASQKAQSKQKTGYDVRTRSAVLVPGDRVLVRRLAFEGKHKIADRWEEDSYVVISQPNTDIPVFVVENHNSKKRTLHRNHLLPIGYVSSDTDENPKLPPKPTPRPRPRRTVQLKTPIPPPVTDTHDGIDSNTDTEDDFAILSA